MILMTRSGNNITVPGVSVNVKVRFYDQALIKTEK